MGAMAAAWKPVVKNGKFYHYYPKGRAGNGQPEYVYIRPAGSSQSSTGGGGPATKPPSSEGRDLDVYRAPAQVKPTSQPMTLQPFLSADDMLALTSFRSDTDLQLHEIDKQLGELAIDTNYQRQQTARNYKKDAAATDDDAAGRGIFRSSIRDAALDDLKKIRTTNTKLLDDRMSMANANANTAKGILARRAQEQQLALAQKQRENAQQAQDAITASRRDSGDSPAPGGGGDSSNNGGGGASAGAARTQSTGGYRNVVKNGKFYRHYPASASSPERWVYVRPASGS